MVVDQSTGDVYVADAGNHRVDKFDAEGNFLAAWGWGVADGAAESQVCTSSCQAGISGSEPGQLETPVFMAVDNSGGPSDSDVYVGDKGFAAVEKFTSTGTFLSSNDGSASGKKNENEEFTGMAVAPNGNLFVKAFYLSKYSQDGSFVGKLNAGFPCGGLAVDSSENVYDYFRGESEGKGTVKFSFLGGFSLSYEVFRAGAESIVPLTVDPVSEPDTLYAAREGVVQTYQPTTHPQLSPPLEEFGQGHVSATPGGIGVRGSNSTAYVTNPGAGDVEVFSSATIPDAVTTAASDLNLTSATLNGTVNPIGIDAHYQFEWGETASYGNVAPASPADAGSGSEAIAVSEGIAGLQLGTTYHYRLSASNENGTFHGLDQVFTTLVPVAIKDVFASSVSSTGATVNATINPGGGPATYHVEYGTTEAYGQSVPATDAVAGSGSSDHPISQPIQGLEPDTTYHYRFVAQNAGGPVEGEDRTFHTFGLPQFGLPDSRAYEMVSPPDKNGGDVATHPDLTRVAADGNAIVYPSKTAFGDAQGTNGIGNEYIAERGPNGWASHGITPLQIPQEFPQESSGFVGDFSPDLSKAVFLASSTLEPGHPNVQDNFNLYGAGNLRTPHGGAFQLLSDSVNPISTVSGSPYATINLDAASADFSHVLFEDKEKLTHDADSTSNLDPKLYESVNGSVRLEGLVPPAGETSCGPSGPGCEVAAASIGGSGATEHAAVASSGNPGTYTTHTISADGSRVFFEAAPLSWSSGDPTGEGNFGTLYMREDGETTTQLNVSERGTPDPNGAQPAKFLDATPDGSKVFFVTKQELIDEDLNTSYDVYMYDVEKPEGERLTLISRDENGLDGEGDAGFVVGASSDGSYVYFTDRNMLAPGQPSMAELGLEPKPGLVPEFMYAWHEGEVRFVGAHMGEGSGQFSNWGDDAGLSALSNLDQGQKTAVVSADGKHVVFTSNSTGLAQLTAGYSNTNATNCQLTDPNHPPCQEIYAYSYETDHLACASCDSSGQAPLGRALTTAFADDSDAALLSQHVNRPITEDGHWVFFSSPDPLAPGDTNNRYDAYEYNTQTGKASLLSSGQCNCDSYFVEASPDGHDVFFSTRQRLVAIDGDSNADLYDARIGGGIAAQNRVPPPGCEGDACQSLPSTPGTPTLSTSVPSGPGNQPPRSRAHHRKKRHHKEHGRHHRHAAGARRGGAR